MKHADDNDRRRNGTLPHNPEEDTDPFDGPLLALPPQVPKSRVVKVLSATELAQPLSELQYLVPHLGLAPGAPVLVAGYGFAGKTISLQSMALSMASGKQVWSVYSCQRGSVLHLDFEQGRRITQERYQRLARGMGLELAELGDNLKVAINPEVYLDDRDATEVYSRIFEGRSLVIVDSLRAAAPRSDENSSDVRRAIDTMSRAAEKHGSLLAFIHHARKPKADDPAGARYKIRGSSALYDACASVFVYSAEKGQPTRISHEKCRNRGTTVGDFGLRVEDVMVDGDPRGGLRIVHMEPEQLASMDASTRSPYTAAITRITEFMKVEREFRGSKTALCKRVKMNAQTFYAAFSEMESTGMAMQGIDEKGTFVRWLDSANETPGGNPTGDVPVDPDSTEEGEP